MQALDDGTRETTKPNWLTTIDINVLVLVFTTLHLSGSRQIITRIVVPLALPVPVVLAPQPAKQHIVNGTALTVVCLPFPARQPKHVTGLGLPSAGCCRAGVSRSVGEASWQQHFRNHHPHGADPAPRLHPQREFLLFCSTQKWSGSGICWEAAASASAERPPGR